MSYLDSLITADEAQRAHANRFGVEEGQYRNLQRMRQADKEAALDRQEREQQGAILGDYMRDGIAPPLQAGPALGTPTVRAPAAAPQAAPTAVAPMRVAPEGAPDPTVSPWRGHTAQTPLTADESARQVAAEQARLQQLRSTEPTQRLPLVYQWGGSQRTVRPGQVDNTAQVNADVSQSEARLAALKSEAAARQQMKPAPSGGFDSAVANVLRREGGYTPRDGTSGAPANFGINQRANPDIDVSKLTQPQAVQLYKTRYWDAIGADKLPAELQDTAFDAAVNQGVGFTQQALQASGGDVQKFNALRAQRYQQIAAQNPQQAPYLNQWMARLGSQNAPAVQTAQAPAAQPMTPGKPEYDRGQAFMPEQVAANNERRNQIMQQYEMLQRLGNTTRDPGKKLQVIQQMQELRSAAGEAQLDEFSTAAAQGSTPHLTALVQLASQSTGSPFGVADAGNGQVVFVRTGRDNQPVYSPPMAMSEAAGQLKLLLSAKLQAKRAEQENAYRLELLKSRGKAEGEEPSKIREEAAKAQYGMVGEEQKAANARQLAEINNNADMARRMVQLGIERQNLRFVASPVGDGSGVMSDGTGRIFEYKPGARDPRTGIVMDSTIKQVQ